MKPLHLQLHKLMTARFTPRPRPQPHVLFNLPFIYYKIAKLEVRDGRKVRAQGASPTGPSKKRSHLPGIPCEVQWYARQTYLQSEAKEHRRRQRPMLRSDQSTYPHQANKINSQPKLQGKVFNVTGKAPYQPGGSYHGTVLHSISHTVEY